VRFLVVAVAALYLLTFGILLAIFALALWASEANRPAILGGFAGVFLAAGSGVGLHRRAVEEAPSDLQETIAILKGRREGVATEPAGHGDD
jgi:membrane protein implicated in regulation of membrane protease activity